MRTSRARGQAARCAWRVVQRLSRRGGLRGGGGATSPGRPVVSTTRHAQRTSGRRQRVGRARAHNATGRAQRAVPRARRRCAAASRPFAKQPATRRRAPRARAFAHRRRRPAFLDRPDASAPPRRRERVRGVRPGHLLLKAAPRQNECVWVPRTPRQAFLRAPHAAQRHGTRPGGAARGSARTTDAQGTRRGGGEGHLLNRVPLPTRRST